MHPLKSEQPAIVYIDVKSPYAFVAIKPTLALEAKLGIQFDWRALTLDIPSYLGSAKKSGGKVVQSNRSASQWGAVKYAYRDARRYAEGQGDELHGTTKIWDSRLINIAFQWVAARSRDQLGAFLLHVYPQFWRRDLDVEDMQVVCNQLQTVGVDASGFQDYVAGDGGAQHDTLQAQLHGHGIYGVPTYVVNGEISFGREHLPYVEWQLQGATGPMPDIAYPAPSETPQ